MALGTGVFNAKTAYPGFLLNLLAVPGVLNPGTYTHTNIAVNGVTTVWSNSFFLRRGVTFGWEVAFTGTTVAVTVELEQGNQPPTTEGAADGSWVIPVDRATTNGMFPTGNIVAAATTYITGYQPDATILGRLKISGTGSNSSDVILTLARLYEIKNF